MELLDFLFQDIRSLQEGQKGVSVQLEENQTRVHQLQGAVDEGDLWIDRLNDERQRVSFLRCSYN